ncbi:MAG TPA: sulfatase [Thermoplasmata archaeon]|nr:sulfatase [Thermoplasmata archaeon]
MVDGRPEESERPNVVTIVLDCVRAKSVGLSGGRNVACTPNLDGLAARGTNFPRAVAPSNWTVPSHMSIFTGRYPSAHGRRSFVRGGAPASTTAQWLAEVGYETALFSEMVHLAGGYGLEDGFGNVRAARVGVSDEERTAANRLLGHARFLYSERVRRAIARVPPLIVPLNALNHPQEQAFKRAVCGDGVVSDFDQWVTGRSTSKPFYAFLNFVDGHEPYPIVPNGSRLGPLARWYARTPRYYLLAVDGLQRLVPWESVERGYLAAIEAADAKVGRVWRALERAGVADRTVLIVTADHGQSFGEAGNIFHGCGGTDSITRVPLVVVPPRSQHTPPMVDRWASLCELDPWIRSFANGGTPDYEAPWPRSGGLDLQNGSSGTVYCEGGPASDPNRSLIGVRGDQSWNHRLLVAYRQDEKVVWDQVTGSVVSWTYPGDPDSVAPTVLEGGAARAAREHLFAPYLRPGAAPGPTPSGDARSSVDARLRSWGYD